MLDTMSEKCSQIIEALGSSWVIMGWVFFAGWFLSPFFAPSAQAAMALFLLFAFLGLIWWIIDALDQQVAWWQVAVAALMIGIGFLPRGGILLIATWVIYWTRVRE